MIGVIANTATYGVIAKSDNHGIIAAQPAFSIHADVRLVGILASSKGKNEEFDATGYWVWADGVWVEWFDGEVIEQ